MQFIDWFLLCFFYSTFFVIGQNQQAITPPPAQPDFLAKFEYKHSFRKPHIADKQGQIFLWSVDGDAIAHSDQLRLAPSLTSKAGRAWNIKPIVESEFWVVEMTLRISGRGSLGADGMAMWYTSHTGLAGPVFGSNDRWVGMGIFFDSFENAFRPGISKTRELPVIAMMLNDGTKVYNHEMDGGADIAAKCHKDYRNRPHPVKAKIEYLKNTVTLYLTNGNTPNDAYELCLKVENVFLPKNGYFGLSAATGGLADDHDVLAFETYSYNTAGGQAPSMMPTEEQKRLDEEYKTRQQEFESERQKFKEQHPDKFKSDDEMASQFEDPQMRQMNIIQEVQQGMFKVLQQLDSKMEQLSQTQQNILQTKGAPPVQVPGVAPVVSGDGLQRQEANELIQASRELVGAVRDLKHTAADIQSRIITVDQRLLAAASASAGAAVHPSDSIASGVANEQRESIDNLRQKVDLMVAEQRKMQIVCAAPSCLSSSIFLVIIAVQTVLLIFFAILKRRSEKPKFY